MMNSSYTKYFTLLLLFPFLCSSFGCNTASSPSPVTPIANEINDPLSDDWYHDLTNWLSLSYIETDENACFSSYPVEILESPDLYTTYIAMGILTNLGNVIEIPNKQSIVDWVESLRHEQGFYTDPVAEGRAPSIDETRQAVEILVGLGWYFPQKDSTIDLLLSLQKSHGLFSYNITPTTSENTSLEKSIVATNSAVITLANLGFANWEALGKTAEALQGYLEERLNQVGDSYSLQTKEMGSVILAIWSLALIDHPRISEQSEQFIRNSLKEIPHLSGEMLMVSRINNLLEAAKALNLEETVSEDTLKDLNEYIIKEVFTQQLENGMFLEPFMTHKVVRLANKANTDVPNQKKIAETLEKYRIEAGWVPSVQLNMQNKAQHTYYALNILQIISVKDFDLNLLHNYLENILLSDDDQFQEIYYALISYKFINSKLNQNILRRVEEISVDIAQNLGTSYNHAPDWGYFVLISEEAGFKISDDFKDRIAVSANQLKSKMLEDNIYRNPVLIHLLWTITGINTSTSLDNDEVNRLLMPLYCDSGGFSGGSFGTPADIHSTYLALQVIENAGLTDNINSDKLIKFVLSCKSQYGFCGMSAQSVDYPLMSDFRSTYEALDILNKYGYKS